MTGKFRAFDLDHMQTLVIKIGTALLSGRRAFDGRVMEAVVKEICALKREHDINVLIVTSGAVGCGMNTLGLTARPADLRHKQAVAAVGQATLMHYYETLFLTYGDGLRTAQVLLSCADLANRRSYLNVRNTLQTLFEMKQVIPILNENDSTAVEELRFGDNDTLSAKIAAKINADLLIILTDVDGLYDKNPREADDAQLIDEVDKVTEDIEAFAGGAGTIAATGGMRTKLDAARIGAAAGVPVVLANGHTPGIVHGVLSGSVPRTLFLPAKVSISHRKRWIAFGQLAQGTLHIDDGARKALLEKGKSLLPAGVTALEGTFAVGASVRICDAQGHDLARGLVNYSSSELERIRGHKTTDIEGILGHKDYDEVIHRDNLVLL
jgi:glutamate 5-kinase